MEKSSYSRYYTYIQPILKNPTVKSFAPIIFSLLTVAFFAVFVIRPTIATILTLNQSIEESRQVLQALNTKSQNLETGKRNLLLMDPDIRNKIDALIPSSPAVTTAVKSLQVNATSSTTSATIIQIQPLNLIDNTTTQSTGKLGEASFNYTTQDTYSDLTVFLKAINKMARLITIDSLSIGKQPGDDDASLTISGRAFYLQ